FIAALNHLDRGDASPDSNNLLILRLFPRFQPKLDALGFAQWLLERVFQAVARVDRKYRISGVFFYLNENFQIGGFENFALEQIAPEPEQVAAAAIGFPLDGFVLAERFPVITTDAVTPAAVLDLRQPARQTPGLAQCCRPAAEFGDGGGSTQDVEI